MALNSYFDRIFCINLASRPDRWAACEELFAKHNLQVHRVQAVNGRELPSSHSLTPAELGCKLSHVNVLTEIAANGYSKALILEDDVEFVENLQADFDELIGQAPPWEMLYLGGNHIERPLAALPRFGRLAATYTTSSYAVTGAFAVKLLNLLDEPVPIDVAYASLHKQHQCYTVWPSLAGQRPGFSDIQGKITNYSGMRP